MLIAKRITFISLQWLLLSTALAYECTDNISANPGDDIFENEGHCLDSNRVAWLATPTYFVQLLPWFIDDQVINSAEFYTALTDGMRLWGQHQYQHFTNPPAHYSVLFFPSASTRDNVSTISFVNNIEEVCGNTATGCQFSRRGTRITSGFGGIDVKASSDIFLRGNGWSMDPFTTPCRITGVRDLRRTVNHEIGHGLGTAHQEPETDTEPSPIMGSNRNDSGCIIQPLAKEMGDVDHLYKLTRMVNEIEIQSPPADSQHDFGALINFIGEAFTKDGVDISDRLVWTSSLIGSFGDGASVATELPSGTHVISAAVPPDADGSGSGREFDTARDSGIHLGYKTFITPRGRAGSQTSPMPPLNKGSDVFPSSIVIDVLGPVVTEFLVSDNPCFIEIGGDRCTVTLSWNVEMNDFPGGILIKDVEGTVIASSVTGTLAVDLVPGDNLFDLFYRDEKNEDHLLSTLDAFAGEISGVIVGPGQCEIDPPPDDHCPMEIQLAGFADHVILYDLGRDISLFELDAEGLFATTFHLEVPIDGIQLGLFADDVIEENRLAEKSISTFRIADQYEDDDFVSGFQSLTEIDDKLQTLFLNQRQLDHNFHKAEDMDFVRVPFLTNLGLSSIRTRNLTPGLATTIDIGCVRYRSGTHRYESLDGGNSLRVEEGPEAGSAIATWTTGVHPSGCLGESYFAKIDWLELGPDPAPTYDVLFVNGREDPYEPDDNRGDAGEIRLNEVQTRNFDVDKVDWLMFSPSSNAEYELSLSSSSSFLNPCIRIERNLSSLVDTCLEGPPFGPVNFTTGAPVQIRITNSTARAATVYHVEITEAPDEPLGEPDVYEEDDDINALPLIFLLGPGTHIQHRNFVDDSVDVFSIQCNVCPGGEQPSSGPLILSIPTSSSEACIELTSYGAGLCGSSIPGPNTDYSVQKTCECPVSDPT